MSPSGDNSKLNYDFPHPFFRFTLNPDLSMLEAAMYNDCSETHGDSKRTDTGKDRMIVERKHHVTLSRYFKDMSISHMIWGSKSHGIRSAVSG